MGIHSFYVCSTSFRPTAPPSSGLHYVSTLCQDSLSSIFLSLSFLSKRGKLVLARRQKWGVWRHNVSLSWKESRYAQTGTVHVHCVHVCYCCLMTYKMTISIEPLFFCQENSGLLESFHFHLTIISPPVNHGDDTQTPIWNDGPSSSTTWAETRAAGSGQFPVTQNWLQL